MVDNDRVDEQSTPVRDPVQLDAPISRFNESFYRSDPSDYLLTRFQLLMLAGGKANQLAQLLASGVEYSGMKVGPRDATNDKKEAVEEDLHSFLTIESQQLLHHACETALRLFLVHSSRASVPWVELSSQRSPKKFKQDVRSQFIDESPHRDVVAYVCLGVRVRPDEMTVSDWDGALEGLSAFLRAFAESFLDDANLYNAIKHGLGVTASNAVTTIDSHQLGYGTSVEYPESSDWLPDGTRNWSLTTRWIDIGQSLGLIWVAIQMIRSIWEIGRFRYLGDNTSGEMFLPVSLRPNNLGGPDRPPMQRMTWHLLTEQRR